MRPEWSFLIRRGRMVAGALLVAAVLLWTLAARAGQDDVRGLLETLGIQAPPREVAAPAFALPDLTGKTVRLADYQGRTLMLYFWTTW
jgi:cytochrome oxidase Cu insertion factor (SCO1/SenC/PrrC family)